MMTSQMETAVPLQASPQRARVVIVEDEAFVAESLASLLTRRGIDVVQIVRDGDLAFDVVRRTRPDVVLLDLHLDREGAPPIDGMALLGAIRTLDAAPRVLILSVRRDPEAAAAARKLGASGFLHKLRATGDSIASAVLDAARGEQFVDAGAFASELRAPSVPPSTRLGHLSPREREVLAHVAAGADNLKIAAALGISERTVRAHVCSIYRKLERENRTELALLARDLGVRPASS